MLDITSAFIKNVENCLNSQYHILPHFTSSLAVFGYLYPLLICGKEIPEIFSEKAEEIPQNPILYDFHVSKRKDSGRKIRRLFAMNCTGQDHGMGEQTVKGLCFHIMRVGFF